MSIYLCNKLYMDYGFLLKNISYEQKMRVNL